MTRELEVIDRLRRIATAPEARGLMDDVAVLEGFVVTHDSIAEGIHFFPFDPPASVGWKLVAVNLSDLAAKGATPAGFVLTLALPRADETWLAAFARGLGEDAAHYGCPLLGGDTVSTPGPLMISITAFGRVPVGTMVRRGGARPGDCVMVTGTIGDAALGLDLLRGGAVAAALADDVASREILVGRYRVPQPRNALARGVRDHASAAMDVSDGLAGDLAKLCAASGVSAVIEVPRVPTSAVAAALLARGATGIEALVSGGDDYELLCTVADAHCERIADAARGAGVALTAIGRIVAEPGAPRFLDAQGRVIALARLSYSHF
jgi:thiamine-monophosphate kinase